MLLFALLLVSCGGWTATAAHDTVSSACVDGGTDRTTMPTFADDVAFLREHTPDLIVLEDGGAAIAVSPFFQGRVMTSTAGGDGGASFGWIHRPVIATGERQPHMTVAGGEDRFWLGPEGGPHALYFPPDAAFDLEHWQVPEGIDWGAWNVRARDERSVELGAHMELVNRAGTRFEIDVTRRVSLLAPSELGSIPDGVRAVGFETDNRMTNGGGAPWRAETGLVSIWILGMFHPSPRTTVVLPFVPGTEEERGPIVNTAYFGEVPPERLVIGDGAVFFRGDGGHRSKIGIPPPRARPVMGSWDAERGVLTIVTFSLDDRATDYVDSRWELMPEPYRGDVINSYNDGPPEPGAPPLGPFYELESSSAAAALAPGSLIRHVHRTFHLTGPRNVLDALARTHLGVGLDTIDAAFP